jgi:type I restriction enzyme S subunit
MSAGNGWPVARWGDVLEIKNGRNQKEVEDVNGAYPIYGSGGVMGRANDYICEAQTTIIGRKGSISSPLFVEEPFWNVDTAFGLHALDELDPRFLFYFCKHYDFWQHNRGTTIPSLVKSELLEIRMPHPPLPEQQRIVGKLDSAFAALTEAQSHVERNRANARELFESCLNGVFAGKGDDWVEKRLDELVTDYITKGTTPTTYGHDWVEEGIPFLRSECVSANGFAPSGIRYITPEAHHQLARSVVRSGDVLISITGNVGRVVRYPSTMPEGNINQHIARVRIERDDVLPDFVVYQLLTQVIQEHYANIHVGAAYPLLSLKQIRETIVQLPSLKEQRKIVEQMDQIKSNTLQLETTYQQKLTELAGLKKAVLGAAFRGEL